MKKDVNIANAEGAEKSLYESSLSKLKRAEEPLSIKTKTKIKQDIEHLKKRYWLPKEQLIK